MRLFVALDLSAPLRDELALLRGSLPNVQWIPKDNYHLTLRFIGEVTSRAEQEEIDLALGQLSWAPFELSLLGAGLREHTKTDTLIIHIEQNDALTALQSQIEKLLRRAGCDTLKKRFHPHIALGHISSTRREESARWVQAHNLFRSTPMSVQHVTLFESLKGFDQRTYVHQAEYAWHPNMTLVPGEEL
ncbi:RNA 2',3'-cyclic phosphodiesterase [Neokomagataea tanensis]|uniref:RNA 2',3'-cyclic phosphodiesterase n=1 Tax=Neokomagataea tanensis TaxID=661191 RepID=A0A4Y6VBM7_9PROT|nr:MULTISPECIES: RNA 2',3'-cyclic phosphodiesterase [Neokomagataea]QDH25906.1 RNA 2',3'-cyclic phosphodiesterase [Neokomagataea tanensis]